MNAVSECTTKFKLYLLSSLKLLIQNDLLVLFLVFYHQRKNSVKFLYLFVGGEPSSHIGGMQYALVTLTMLCIPIQRYCGCCLDSKVSVLQSQAVYQRNT